MFFFSYNENVELEQNFKKTIIVIKKVLRMWRRRSLTLEGRIIIFKALGLWKFVFLAQVLPIPNEIATTIQRIQRKFLWNSSNIKIKHKTICNEFQNGGLKDVDIDVAKFLAYNALGLKNYTTKTPMTGN